MIVEGEERWRKERLFLSRVGVVLVRLVLAVEAGAKFGSQIRKGPSNRMRQTRSAAEHNYAFDKTKQKIA